VLKWLNGSAALVALLALCALPPAPSVAAQRVVLAEKFTATW
jgi:hypothetical protein